MRRFSDETNTSEEAEQRFIELYRDKERTAFWIRHLFGVEGLRERFHQIERAREHYDANQFDSTVLHLIAVMDGFVNDFEPERRQGLSAREPDDMTAWDSVVSHHMGLTHALKAFDKTIKKRVDDEVYELHRHGIVHGTITHFDNVVVATKAWNMLFALVDWAEATTKSRQPEEPEPTFKEFVQGMAKNAKIKAKLGEWESSHLSVVDAGFDDHELYALTVEFLTAWRDQNFRGASALPEQGFPIPRSFSRPDGWAAAGTLREHHPVRFPSDSAGEHSAGNLGDKGSGHRESQVRDIRVPLDHRGG